MPGMDRSSQSPFEPFDGMDFSENQCFLCGTLLQEDTDSKEHIFPKWLLRRYDLWDETITLLNRTSIPYRYLTIPCCSTCNNEYLSRLESEIELAANNGPSAVAQVEKVHLYQWIGKIFFGLLYRELSLSADRSKPELGPITTPEFLEDFRALHGFIQSIAKPIEFHEFFPGSLFVFEVEPIPEIGDFDYSDNFVGMSFFIRMGNIGIIACLKDDEQILGALSELYQAMRNRRLHPIQFDELCAIVFYQSCLMVRNGKYMSMTTQENQTMIIKLPGFSLAPVFEEWDNQLFARFLESFWSKWGLIYDEIFIPPNSFRSYLGEDI